MSSPSPGPAWAASASSALPTSSTDSPAPVVWHHPSSDAASAAAGGPNRAPHHGAAHKQAVGSAGSSFSGLALSTATTASSSSARPPASSASSSDPDALLTTATTANSNTAASSVFAPNGTTAFAAFLSPASPSTHADPSSSSSSNSSSTDSGLRSISTASSRIVTRPRAGTLPSNLFSDELGNDPALARNVFANPSRQAPIGSRPGVSASTQTLSAQAHPDPASIFNAPDRPLRRQTFYPAGNNIGNGSSIGGSSSASLTSAPTFQPFYPLRGSLSASASRPGSASGGVAPSPLGVASSGGALVHPSSASASTSSSATATAPAPAAALGTTQAQRKTTTTTSPLSSSLSLSVLSGAQDREGTQQASPASASKGHFFPGRLRGHTTTLLVGTSVSGPAALGTAVSSSTETSPNPSGGGSSPSSASQFIRQPSPLGLGTSTGTTGGRGASASSNKVTAATAPSSTLHSPLLGDQAGAPFFGSDGLFGSGSGVAGTPRGTTSPTRSTTNASAIRGRPSTISAVGSGADWSTLGQTSSTSGTASLFGVESGTAQYPTLRKGSTSSLTASSSDFYMQPSNAEASSATRGDARAPQPSPAFLSRIGSGLRVASSGPTPNSNAATSSSGGRTTGLSGFATDADVLSTAGLTGTSSTQPFNQSTTRSRALTLAHPSPNLNHVLPGQRGVLGSVHSSGYGRATSSHHDAFDQVAESDEMRSYRAALAAVAASAAPSGMLNQEDGSRIASSAQASSSLYETGGQGQGPDGPGSMGGGDASSGAQKMHSVQGRPRAISTGAPPFFSRAVASSGGGNVARDRGNTFYLGQSASAFTSPRLEDGRSSLDGTASLYGGSQAAHFGGTDSQQSHSQRSQLPPSITASKGLPDPYSVLAPETVRMLQEYALHQGLNPTLYVQAAAEVGFGVSFSGGAHGGTTGGGGGLGNGSWGLNTLASSHLMSGRDEFEAGMSAGGVGSHVNVDRRTFGAGRPSVWFQEPSTAASGDGHVSSLLSSFETASGTTGTSRPTLSHTQSTSALPPPAGGHALQETHTHASAELGSGANTGMTAAALSGMSDYLGLSSASTSSTPTSASMATASFRARAATASSSGLGGGPLTMTVAAHMMRPAAQASTSATRTMPHSQLAQHGGVLESGLRAGSELDGTKSGSASGDTNYALPLLMNRFRSGTMAAGAAPGFGSVPHPHGLGASSGQSRLRQQQELMRMAAVVKANQASGASANDQSLLLDAHEATSQAASEALAAAINATGEPSTSLLPPAASANTASHGFTTRPSRSNSHVSVQSGFGTSPNTPASHAQHIAAMGPSSGGSSAMGQARPRAATTAALTSSSRDGAGGYFGHGTGSGSGAVSGRATPANGPGGHGSFHLGSSHGTSVAGGGGGNGGNQQTPTRSLWIGNLDPSVTAQELMRAFAPYGAVESVRLLPEKECGFVNFVELDDAMRAREDVLGRLGGRLALAETPVGPSGQVRTGGTGLNGQVRIGYGKVDSAPGVVQPPLGPTADVPVPAFGGAGVGGTFGEAGPDGYGTDDMLPTRALWIGSIPSTTTQKQLLDIFQPFGPIESVRVLTHKNCGFINYEHVEDAIQARNALHGRDLLGTDHGAIRIGFAKVPTRNIEEFASLGDAGAMAGNTAVVGSGLPAYPRATIDALTHLQGANGMSGEDQLRSGYIENYRSNLVVSLLQQDVKQGQQQSLSGQDQLAGMEGYGTAASDPNTGSAIAPSDDRGGVSLPAHLQPRYSVTDLQLLIKELSENDPPAQAQADIAAAAEVRPLATYYTTIPLVAEVCKNRRFDANRLREIRRLMDSPNFSMAEVDNLAQEYMKDIVDLAADYIGNTAVQKFFERASEDCKYTMLKELAPHLAMIGIHKNGTWSAQKIIDTCRRPDQVELISRHLRPYVPPLMLDQFGNYVVQCVLPFGTPTSDFVFDAIVDRIWEIAQGRFGARSMRACLENSNHVTRRQVKRVAAVIILHAVPLSTNANGALLLTWLLDTSGLPARYRLLAPRFAPHLAQLCTHKLASLTIWRIVSQKTDVTASRLILDALFGKPDPAGEGGDQSQAGATVDRSKSAKEVTPLEEIVVDQLHGSAFIAKVLASSAVDAAKTDGRPDKPSYVDQVRKILIRHRLVGAPAYRRLLEEVGLNESLPASSMQGPLSPPSTLPMNASLSHGVHAPTGFGPVPPQQAPQDGTLSLPLQPANLVPPHLLSAAAAGDPAALQELAHLGFLPTAAPSIEPSADLGAVMGAMRLNGPLAPMYGPGGTSMAPPPPPLGGMPLGHRMGGGQGPANRSLGGAIGHHPLPSPSRDAFSMSPEQAVGSGVLSPPPTTRMGWSPHPHPSQPPQVHPYHHLQQQQQPSHSHAQQHQQALPPLQQQHPGSHVGPRQRPPPGPMSLIGSFSPWDTPELSNANVELRHLPSSQVGVGVAPMHSNPNHGGGGSGAAPSSSQRPLSSTRQGDSRT